MARKRIWKWREKSDKIEKNWNLQKIAGNFGENSWCVVMKMRKRWIMEMAGNKYQNGEKIKSLENCGKLCEKKQLMCSDDNVWLTSWERVSSRKGWIWRRGWGRGQGRTGPTALCGFFPKVVNQFTNGALFAKPTTCSTSPIFVILYIFWSIWLF